MDAEKGLDAKTFKKDTNFLFCRDWICVFGHRGVTSKEAQASSWVLDGSGFWIFLVSASAVHTGVGLSRPLLSCMH